jgi:UDP-glucose:(galactosyl)LPS alpha-1,2-glucosyltransferase
MTIIPICFFFNKRIVIPAGVCITSLLKKAKSDTFYDIFVFHPGDLREEHKSTLTKLKEIYPKCNFTFVDMSNKFDNAYILRGIPNVTYYRLLVPELVPQYNKVVVSDVDIIFDTDLAGLYNTVEFDGNYLAAVKSPLVKIKYVKSLGCDPYNYVNCGFFVYNSLEIRKNKISDKFKELVGNKYFYLDQDIINIVCKDKITFISPKYNVSQCFYERYFTHPDRLRSMFSHNEILEGLKAGVLGFNKNENEDTGLIHYNGVNPWEKLCWRHDIWWEYYRNSIYFDNNFYHEHYKRLLYPPAKELSIRIIRVLLKKYLGKWKNKIFPT